MAIFQQLTISRVDFHSVGAGFYITLIGAAVLLAMLCLHYQRRAAAMRAVATRLGFEYRAETLPPSLDLRGTGLNSATSTWNVIEGKRHGVRVVAFDCRLGTGKGSWRRSVIAAEGSARGLRHVQSRICSGAFRRVGPPLSAKSCVPYPKGTHVCY